MTPDDFIRKWQGVTLREKPAAQKHVLDLRALVGVESSAKADHRETGSAARRARPRPGGSDGWADVWRRGRFDWEYKRPGADLKKAFGQLQNYTPALDVDIEIPILGH